MTVIWYCGPPKKCGRKENPIIRELRRTEAFSNLSSIASMDPSVMESMTMEEISPKVGQR